MDANASKLRAHIAKLAAAARTLRSRNDALTRERDELRARAPSAATAAAAVEGVDGRAEEPQMSAAVEREKAAGVVVDPAVMQRLEAVEQELKQVDEERRALKGTGHTALWCLVLHYFFLKKNHFGGC